MQTLMARTAILYAVLLILSCHVPEPMAAEQTSITKKFDIFSNVEKTLKLSSRERGIRIGLSYDELFGVQDATKLRALSTKELNLLFRATNSAAFYALRLRDAENLRLILDELFRRNEANRQHFEDVYGAYVAMRHFDDARALANTHKLKDLEDLPPLVDSVSRSIQGPTVLRVDLAEHKLTRQALDIRSGTKIIVISHPLCHFSRNAVQAIEQDAVLSVIFKKDSVWIAPTDRRLYVKTLQDWNRSHPVIQYSLAYDLREWPMVDSWATPTFYFLKNGMLVDKVTGWPEEGQREALIEAAGKAGLEP